MKDSDRTNRSKVACLIESYGLDGVGEELELRWTRSENRSSLRDLAEYFNIQLLEAAYRTNDVEPVDGEIENLYRLLTSDDVTSGTYRQALNRLSQRGIDVDQLQDDFVSYQSIRTYLKQYRNAKPPETNSSPQDHRDTKEDRIQRLKSRLSAVTKQSLTELRNGDYLILGDFSVIVNVRIHCGDCDTQLSVTQLLRQGKCGCER